MTIVLSSSDARAQYAQDILTVLAAPAGLHVQFRYDKRYVAQDLQHQIAQGDVKGKAAVVAFVGNVATADAYLLPVRLATITEARDVADAYVIQLAVREYVDLSDWPTERDAIITRGQPAILDAYGEHGRPVAAMGKSGRVAVTPANVDMQSWATVKNRLAALEPFSKSYFARLSIANADGKPRAVSTDGSIAVRYRRTIIVKCWYDRNSEPPQDHTVRVITDDKVLDFSSDSTRPIRGRYDEVEFWMYAKPLSPKYRRVLTLELEGAETVEHDVPTRVNLPVIAYRPVLPRIAQFFLSGLGAILVAMPALLGTGAQTWHKVLFAVSGAILIALVTVFADMFTGARS